MFFTFGKIEFDINTRCFLSADFCCSLESSRSYPKWPKVSQFCISRRSKINLKKKKYKHLNIKFQSDLLSTDKALKKHAKFFHVCNVALHALRLNSDLLRTLNMAV